MIHVVRGKLHGTPDSNGKRPDALKEVLVLLILLWLPQPDNLIPRLIPLQPLV